jgi:hypothetical protein
MVWVRQLNARWSRNARPAIDAGDAGLVTSLQLRGLVADFVRGGLVTAVSLGVLFPAHRAASALWGGGDPAERAVLAGLTAALGGATIWMLVRGTRGARICIAAGLVVGIALLI